MRLIHLALLGALHLSVAASLAGCSTSGEVRKNPDVVVQTQVVEVPRRQLVRVSGEMTSVPRLAPAPRPAVTPATDPACDRPTGCFSGRQLESMLTTALAWGQGMADQLEAIRRLMQDTLTKGTTDETDPAPVP